MSIGEASDRAKEICYETPKDTVLRSMPHLKLKRVNNKFYILFDGKKPFSVSKSYDSVWINALSKIWGLKK